MNKHILTALTCLALTPAITHAEDSAAETARKVRQEIDAKTQAAKARNDAIVEQQRAAERAAKAKAEQQKKQKSSSGSSAQ